MVVDFILVIRYGWPMKNLTAILFFFLVGLSNCFCDQDISVDNFQKEIRETIVSSGVYSFSVKLSGTLVLSWYQKGDGGGLFDGRTCQVTLTQKTFSTRPCLVDHRTILDLPIKGSQPFSCPEDYYQISSHEVYSFRINKNCEGSMSQVKGTLESHLNDPEYPKLSEIDGAGQFYRFLNEEKDRISQLGFVHFDENKDNNANCSMIPSNLRQYCEVSGNCAVNVNEPDCIRIFNKTGLWFLGKILPSNKDASGLPLTFSAAIDSKTANAYSGSVVIAPGAVGWAGNSDWFASEGTRYDRWARDSEAADREARKNVFKINNSIMETKRAEFQKLQSDYQKIEEEASGLQNPDDFKFLTHSTDPNYRKLYFAAERQADSVKTVLANSASSQFLGEKENRLRVLEIAKFQRHLADQEIHWGNYGLGGMIIQGNLELLDTVLDFTPWGMVKNTLSFMTGYSCGGRKLGSLEKSMSLGFVFLPSILKGGAAGFVKLAGLLKAASLEAGSLKYLPTFVNIIQESDAELKYLAKTEGEVQEIGKLTGEFLESAEKAGVNEMRDALELDEMLRKGADVNAGKIESIEAYIGGKMVRYNPMLNGPLHSISQGTMTVADTFRSSSYFATKLEKPIKLYRSFDESTREFARYWSRIKPTGPYQATLDLALVPEFKNTATKWAEITVPAGEVIYEGFASPFPLRTARSSMKVGELLGGGSQVFLDGDVSILAKWRTDWGKFL
jgi:hypothetical protein